VTNATAIRSAERARPPANSDTSGKVDGESASFAEAVECSCGHCWSGSNRDRRLPFETGETGLAAVSRNRVIGQKGRAAFRQLAHNVQIWIKQA
jgi:hypothetical protein